MKRRARLGAYRIAPLPSRFPARVLDVLTWLWYLGSLVQRELRPAVHLALAQRWRAWRRGFQAQSFVIYRLDAHAPRDYLSDYAITKTYRINGPFNSLFRDKLVFSEIMTRLGVPHPRTHALLHQGRVHALDGNLTPGPLDHWLRDLLEVERRLVLKPALGGMGTGLIFLTRTDDAFDINGLPLSLADLRALLAGLEYYLVTEFVQQADYAATVYPRTTNTLRVLTLWDRAVGAPFIAAAAHRFGTTRSFPVDKWPLGISAKLDADTGELGPGATLSAEGRLCWFERHPESNTPVQGVRVPFWPETRATILRLAAHLPYAPAVGWDLVITERGCSCLEGNSPPATGVWQVHRPLLADPRVRRFYNEHGVTRGRSAVS